MNVSNGLKKALGYKNKLLFDSQLKSHPDFPSYEALQYASQKNGLKSLAINTHFEQLINETPKPLIVRLHAPVHKFVVLDRIDEYCVHILNGSRNRARIKNQEFIDGWDQTAMIFDWQNFKPKRISTVEMIRLLWQKYKPVVLGIMLFFLLLYQYFLLQTNRDFSNHFFLVSAIVGFVITLLLQLDDLGYHNPISKKVCSLWSQTGNNCNDITKSPAAKLFGMLSWSDIGFLYFTTFLVVHLQYPSQPQNIFSILISLLAFPFIPYSLYFQKYKAKSWCVWCLFTIGVLFIMAVYSAFLLTLTKVTYENMSKGMICFAYMAFFVLLIFLLIKPILKDYINLIGKEKEFMWLKHRREVKDALIKNQSKIVPPDDSHFFELGNSKGNSTLTLIISLNCIPCLELIKDLSPILRDKSDTRVELIITAKDNSLESNERKFAEILIANCLANPGNAMDILYDYATNYPLSFSSFLFNNYSCNYLGEAKLLFQSNLEWIFENKILKTPSIFLNYREIDPIYQASDIDYMVK